MADSRIGKRVGAFASIKDGTVSFFGYGVYEGDDVPPVEIKMLGDVSPGAMGHKNPKIRLDSGDIVWGCECWWGPEDVIRTTLRDRRVVIITPAEYRKPTEPTP